MKLKKILSLTLAALLVSACFVFTPVYATGASLSASATSVTVGETVTVSFSVSGSQLGGAQGTFTFSNPGIISSPRLSKGNNWTWDSSGNSFSAFGDSVSGSTTVATVSFTAQSAGTVTVGISGVEVTDDYDSEHPSATPVTIKIKDKPKPSNQPSGGNNTQPSGGNNTQPSGGNNTRPSGGNNTQASDGSSNTSASNREPSGPNVSTDAVLASLQISNAELSPDFRPDVLTYTAIAADDAETLDIKATPNDSKAKVSISGNRITDGETAEVRILVTAESGDTKTYTVHATHAQNAASLSGNNRLASLEVDTGSLSPAFDPDTLNYVVWLPYEADQITVTAKAEDEKALTPTVEGDGSLKENEDNHIKVTSTAENGDARIYNIIAKRAIAPEYDPSLMALNPITTSEETAERIETLGKAYGQGTVTASLSALDSNILQAMKQYPGVTLVLTFEGATLRLSGSDLTDLPPSLEPEEDGYPLQFQKSNSHVADFQQLTEDPNVFCFTFGGGALPGSALISVQTDFSEGETVRIYGIEGQYTYLWSKGVTVGKDGVVTFRSSFLGDTAISTNLETAGLSVLPDGDDSGQNPPLWILLAGGGVLLFIGFGLGIAIKAALHRRKACRSASSGENVVEPAEEIPDFFASPQPFSSSSEEDGTQEDPYQDLWNNSSAPPSEHSPSSECAAETPNEQEHQESQYDEPLFSATEIPPLSDEYFDPTNNDGTPDKPLRPKNGRRYRK